VARSSDVDDFDDDAEALSWIGDEEQGRSAPRLRDLDAETAAPPTEADGPEDAPGSGGRRAATVGFAVPYLALTIGWIFAVQFYPSPSELLASVLWQFGEFLSMLVAPLWFAATLTLTGDARPLVRVGWLALGLGVLLPWPVLIRFLAALQVAGGIS
jgi:hypothetical protein